MSETRSTVSRLERQFQFDQGQALTALRQAYEHVAEQALSLGRERGYVGSDPLGALSQAFAPSPWLRPVGEAAREVWQIFFACFRPDEANFEAKRFSEEAKPISDVRSSADYRRAMVGTMTKRALLNAALGPAKSWLERRERRY